MGLKSKVGSKISSAAKRADMLGAVVGYLGTLVNAGAAYGQTNAAQEVIAVHMNALQRHNTAEIQNLGTRMGMVEWNGLLLSGVGIGLVGLVASYLPSMVPWQGSAAQIAKKAGFGMAVGSLAAIAVGALATGSSPFEMGSTGSTGTASGSVTTAGRFTKPTGQFAPPSPSVGAWSRPSQ